MVTDTVQAGAYDALFPGMGLGGHAEQSRAKKSCGIRVCYLIDTLRKGGTESQLTALIQHLDRKVVTPYLCLLDGTDQRSRSLEPENCTVVRLGIRSFQCIKVIRKAVAFARFIKREKIDILQLQFPDSTLFGTVVGRLAGVQCIVGTRYSLGYSTSGRSRLLSRFTNYLLDATVTNCESCRTETIFADGADPESVWVIQNGVEQMYPAAAINPATRLRRVALVSNLRAIKDPETFIHAARVVIDEYPDSSFTVIGEGDLRSHLERLITQLQIQQHVRLYGSMTDVPNFLRQVDIGVLCSVSEGSSNAVLEYMAAARSIVATDVGGTPELIAHFKHGLLVPPRSPEKLAGAIMTLMRDPITACSLAKAAQSRVALTHDVHSRAQRFESFYSWLLSEK